MSSTKLKFTWQGVLKNKNQDKFWTFLPIKVKEIRFCLELPVPNFTVINGRSPGFVDLGHLRQSSRFPSDLRGHFSLPLTVAGAAADLDFIKPYIAFPIILMNKDH